MRLTVLGSAASFADAGRACSGHLIRSGETAVLFDCGNGVLSNLGKVMDPLALDAVFITHEHVDHFADVYALQAALRYAPDGPRPPMPLHVPPGLFERMGAVLSQRGRIELAEAFLVRELEEDRVIGIGDLTVIPHKVDHVEPTFALVAIDDGAMLCYTADTAPGDAVIAAAHDADVLLAEATLPPAYRGKVAHMTAGEAAELAVKADVRTLVLSHLWPTVDRAAAAREASEIFCGRVIVADELFDLTFP
ncbi:MAG: MBL fold metallo-hydrolase [Coriobacteriia bacterium]|nr:MBL fold metallo-hydrolase [Coriobacteriia bacterium]